MPGLLTRLAITAFGLWIADVALRGLYFDGAVDLFVAALLLGLANAFIRPIIVLLTLPITLVTLGVFLLVINGSMVLLVSSLMEGFHVDDLGTAILAAMLVGITGWVANAYIGPKGRVEVWTVRRGP